MKNAIKHIKNIPIYFFVVGMNAYAANTNINEPSKELQSLIVEGSWLGNGDLDDVKTYPGARSVITQREIQDLGATDIQGVLRNIPGVRVEDETGGTGILPNISVRGLNPLRSVDLQVLVDGIPLALGPYSATGLSLFPVSLDMIDRIDIVRGGAAVQYGPNNVGGVLNIITKPIPNDFKSTIGQTVTSSPGGNFLSTSYLRTGGYVTDNFGTQFQGNITRGNGDRDHTFTEIDNFLVNFDYWPDFKINITSSLQYYHANAELPGALTPEQYEDNWRQSNTPYNQFNADAYRATLVLKHDFTSSSQFVWQNYYNYNKRNFTFQTPVNISEPPTTIDQSPRTYQVFGTEPQYILTFDKLVKQKIILGVRYIYENIFYPVYSQKISTGESTTKRLWNSSTNAIAAYISDTFYFFNDKLQITPGVRVESIYQNFNDEISIDNSKTNYTTQFLPGLTIGYSLNEAVYLFTSAQRSLLPPQMTQVANSNGSSLTPELAMNYELGTRINITKNINTTLTLFRIDFDNKIEKINSTQLANVGKSVQQGIESQVTFNQILLDGLSFTFGYTFLDAKIKEGEHAGNRLPYTSKNQFSLIANYAYDTWNFNVNGFYAGGAYSDPENTPVETPDGSQGPIPAYWLWNATIGKRFKLSEHTELLASFSVHNLFNEQYFFRNVDVSSGITPAPGRQFVFDLQLTV
jgi:Fe(3+) dicitrate transport protein